MATTRTWAKTDPAAIKAAAFDKVEETSLESRTGAKETPPTTTAHPHDRFAGPSGNRGTISTVDLFAVPDPFMGGPLSMNKDSKPGRLWWCDYLPGSSIPAGLTMVSRDKLAAQRVRQGPAPAAPPRSRRGQLTFHEDTDGDGTSTEHNTFVKGLNLATSFELGAAAACGSSTHRISFSTPTATATTSPTATR